jgi:hypothetical protein
MSGMIGISKNTAVKSSQSTGKKEFGEELSPYRHRPPGQITWGL